MDERPSISDVLHDLQEKFKDAGIDTPALDAEVILSHALNTERYRLVADRDRPLTDAEMKFVRRLSARRSSREPVAYITGSKEFYSVVFHVNKKVLIPRPETELLVDLAIFHAGNGARVLDLGTGSGAIAVALKHNRPDLYISASDISAGALSVARKNAAGILGRSRIKFFLGDLFTPFEGKIFDLIVSNPPYIDPEEKKFLQKEILFEPDKALYAENHGRSVIHAIVSSAAEHLSRGGIILMEIGSGMSGYVKKLGEEHGYSTSVLSDYAGLPRVCVFTGLDDMRQPVQARGMKIARNK
jgi:release factor glutamine methyltransferase